MRRSRGVTDGELKVTLDARTLAAEARLGTQAIPIAVPAFPRRAFVIDEKARTITCEAEGLQVSYDYGDRRLALRFEASRALRLSFPATPAWRRPFTLQQKTADVPRTAALIGAVHASSSGSGTRT